MAEKILEFVLDITILSIVLMIVAIAIINPEVYAAVLATVMTYLSINNLGNHDNV